MEGDDGTRGHIYYVSTSSKNEEDGERTGRDGSRDDSSWRVYIRFCEECFYGLLCVGGGGG